MPSPLLGAMEQIKNISTLIKITSWLGERIINEQINDTRSFRGRHDLKEIYYRDVVENACDVGEMVSFSR